jgi:nuclear GTP-binding protein
MKIYNLPTFSSMLEFLTMLVLSTGRLLKVSPVYTYIHIPSLLPNSTPSFSHRAALPIPSPQLQVLVDWNHQKIPFFSEPPALHAAHVSSTIPGSTRQVAPAAETRGHTQIMSAFGASTMLEGCFGEADAGAIDADPNSNPPRTMRAWTSKMTQQQWP